MPIKRRATKAVSRGRFSEFCDEQLIKGPDLMLAGVGYLDLVPSKPACLEQCGPGEREIILTAMRNDWRRRRERLLSTWTGPGLPWAEIEFGELQ